MDRGLGAGAHQQAVKSYFASTIGITNVILFFNKQTNKSIENGKGTRFALCG
jgi:hypothetical protein